MTHEEGIDILLDQAKTDTYDTMMKIGSKAVIATRDVVANAALQGILWIAKCCWQCARSPITAQFDGSPITVAQRCE